MSDSENTIKLEANQVIKLDSASLNRKTRITKEGFLKTKATLTKVGVFEYRYPDGTVQQEFRSPEEVMRAESLDSLKMLPIVSHPYDVGGLVDSKTLKGRQIGHVGENLTVKNDEVEASVIFTDEKLIKKILDGEILQISPGSVCETVKQEGVYKGKHYTHVHKNIVYNHIAPVPVGRQGVRIHLDSKEPNVAICVLTNDEDSNMSQTTIKLDEADYEVNEKVATAFEKLKQENIKANEELKNIKVKLDSLDALNSAKDVEINNLKANSSDAVVLERLKGINKAVNRVKAFGAETLHKIKLDECLSEYDVYKQAVQATTDIKLDEKSNDYIMALFEYQEKSKKDQAISNQRKQIFGNDTQVKNDEADQISEQYKNLEANISKLIK